MLIVADIGVNHGGKRELMLQMVEQAAQAGVDIVKFQSYRADKLRKDWPDYDKTYRFLKEHELSESDHRFLMRHCKRHKVEFLTTVFDLETVDYLKELGLKRIKIASPDCNNWQLIGKCLDNFEQLIISTGMHTLDEAKQLTKYLQHDMERVTVLHCVSLYPTPLHQANMTRILDLFKMFPSVGYSDHTIGTAAAALAMSWGVECLEKHFTLDTNLPGPDHILSATPQDFMELVAWRKKFRKMLVSNTWDDESMRIHINKWSG